MSHKSIGVIIGLVGIVLIAIGLLLFSKSAQAPVALNPSTVGTSTAPLGIASSTEIAQTSESNVQEVITKAESFQVNASDALTSWSFKGSYAGNDILIKQAQADITHLTGLIGKEQYDDYDLYDGIANDYASLGNGKVAYDYYNRAIVIHPKKALAYVNLANLMIKLGAYHTAKDAFAEAVAVEPGMLEYHVERLRFLTEQFPKENAVILGALTDASKQFGDTPAILSIEAEWLAGQKRYADAIKAWQTVKTFSPQDRQMAIDAEIARLQAKQ